MSSNLLLQPNPKNWSQLKAHTLNLDSSLFAGTVTSSIGEMFSFNGLFNIPAPTVNLTAPQLLNTILLSATGNGALTINLPSVADVGTYLNSIGVSPTFNLSFDCEVVNQSASGVTISANGDSNYTLVTVNPLNIQPAGTTRFYKFIYNNAGTSAYFVGG